MPRRLRHPTDPAEKAQRELESFVSKGKRRLHDGAVVSNRALQDVRTNATAAMTRMMKRKDWNAANAAVLVALYEWCHEQVYGVAPSELRQSWVDAEAAVQELVRVEFRGSYVDAVGFVQWVWKREQTRVKARGVKTRITWRMQYGAGYLLTDWRMAMLQEPRP